MACGRFTFSGSALGVWQATRDKLTPKQISNASSWLKNNQGLTFNSDDVAKLKFIEPPSVGVRAELLLKALEKALPDIGGKVHFPHNSPALISWISLSWCKNEAELFYLLESYLEKQKLWVTRAHIRRRTTSIRKKLTWHRCRVAIC